MLKKLTKQLNGEDSSWNIFNTLCRLLNQYLVLWWRKRRLDFSVKVICDLLNLFQIAKVKENNWRVTSCRYFLKFSYVYVVSQYPRFLRAHSNFLKTVFKLFQFIHDMHPRVQVSNAFMCGLFSWNMDVFIILVVCPSLRNACKGVDVLFLSTNYADVFP